MTMVGSLSLVGFCSRSENFRRDARALAHDAVRAKCDIIGDFEVQVVVLGKQIIYVLQWFETHRKK